MTTKSVASFVFCPSCGLLGQLVLARPSTRPKSPFYFRVYHFKNRKGQLKKRIGSHFHSRYAYSCYLGKIAVLDGSYNLYFPEASAFAIAQRMVHFL